MIANKGDLIQWDLDGTIYQSKVAIVDENERWYGVYCDYGQDLIPFDDATIIKNENK